MEDLGYIYLIRNIINNKVYVGVSINHHNRWLQHKLMLNQGKHHSIRLQRAWNKYGEQNFEFKLIKTHPISSLYKEEINQILIFDSYFHGYNMTKGGEGGDWRPVLQYDRFGNFIKRFPSITDASTTLNIHGTYIWNTCHHKTPTAGTFQWCYEGNEQWIKSSCKDRSTVKSIFKYSLEGVFIEEFKNGIEAAKSISKTNNKSIKSIAINIRKACNLNSYISYGYQWRFELYDSLPPLTLEGLMAKKTRGIRDTNNRVNRGNPIYQWTLDGELVKRYENLSDLKLEWGHKIHAIQQCLMGVQKMSHNFYWSYTETFNSSQYDMNKRKYYYRNGQKHIIQNFKS